MSTDIASNAAVQSVIANSNSDELSYDVSTFDDVEITVTVSKPSSRECSEFSCERIAIILYVFIFFLLLAMCLKSLFD